MSNCDYKCDECGNVIEGSGTDPFHTSPALWAQPGGLTLRYHPGCYEAQRERLSPSRQQTPERK